MQEQEQKQEQKQEQEQGQGQGQEQYGVTLTPREVFNMYLEFIDPVDEKLVDLENVVVYADRYIATYNSDEMLNYRKLFKIVFQKFNNKKHTITNTSTQLKVTNNSSGDVVLTITKPEHTDVKTEISRMTNDRLIAKNMLDIEYDKLVRTEHVDAKDKINVENMKQSYIKLITKLYVYKLYYAKVNNILNTKDEKLVTYQHLRPCVINGVINESVQILDAQSYRISKTIIEDINTISSNKLDQFNTIKLNLKSMNPTDKHVTKELRELIIKYLDKTQENDIKSHIKNVVNTQNHEIKEIITELPKLDEKSLSLL